MNIHTVFAHRPAFRTVVQLKRPLDITAPTSQLVKLALVGVGFAPPVQVADAYPLKRIDYLATASGEQIIPLADAPTYGLLANVFINGLLHKDVSDFGHAAAVLTLSAAAEVMLGDHITILYQ